MIVVAIILAVSLKDAHAEKNSEDKTKQKLESIGKSIKTAFKTQTRALCCGTTFPLLFSNLFYGANTTYHQSALPVYLQDAVTHAG